MMIMGMLWDCLIKLSLFKDVVLSKKIIIKKKSFVPDLVWDARENTCWLCRDQGPCLVYVPKVGEMNKK